MSTQTFVTISAHSSDFEWIEQGEEKQKTHNCKITAQLDEATKGLGETTTGPDKIPNWFYVQDESPVYDFLKDSRQRADDANRPETFW